MGVKPPGPPFFLFFGRSFPDDGSLPLVPAAYFAEEGSCGGRGDPRRVGSDEGNRWWVVSRERFGVGRSIHVGRRLFCSSRETENERRETLCFSSRRALSRFVRGAESPPRIAPNRESRFFAETVRGREARGAGSARDRASRDVGGCRRDERVVSSRCASRARSRREPGGRLDAGTRAGAIARPRVVHFDHRHRRETGRREGRHYDARVGFRAGGASRNTRTELGTSPLAAAARLKHSPMTPRASRVTCRPREVVT